MMIMITIVYLPGLNHNEQPVRGLRRRPMKAVKILLVVATAWAALGGAPRFSHAATRPLSPEALGGTMPESGPYQSDLLIRSTFISGDFVPDGNLRKLAWKNAAWERFDRDAFSSRTYPQAQTEVASLWSSNYLYVAFRCKYTELNIYEGEDPARERWELWERDVVEVFVNPRPEHINQYYEFEVAPNNQWIDLSIDLDKNPMNDAGWNSGWEHATHIDPQEYVWTCEMRIPVRALKAPAWPAKTEWRINFFRADGPSQESQRRLLSWSPVKSDKHSFHTPSCFGLIRFVR